MTCVEEGGDLLTVLYLLVPPQSREDEQQNLAVWATISSRYSLDTIYTYKLRIFNNGCFSEDSKV